MKKFTIALAFFIVSPILLFVFAWIPMLAWNHSLHTLYPAVFPATTYIQAFGLMLLGGMVFGRPQYHDK